MFRISLNRGVLLTDAQRPLNEESRRVFKYNRIMRYSLWYFRYVVVDAVMFEEQSLVVFAEEDVPTSAMFERVQLGRSSWEYRSENVVSGITKSGFDNGCDEDAPGVLTCSGNASTVTNVSVILRW